jgi:MraZ protein
VGKLPYFCQAVFLFGEYSARLDPKRRLVIPNPLLSMLPEEHRTHFVLQRAPDPCLWLYPLTVWKEELQKLHEKVNLFTPEGRSFVRLFQSGAQPLSLDSANRLLLPKALCEYAGLNGDVILIGMKDRIEVWDSATYQQWLTTNETNRVEWLQQFLGQ